jgi:hypothetical protein
MKSSWLAPVCCLIALLMAPSVGAQSCKETVMATTPDDNFTVHDNGTARHNTTGLIWMRCSLGQQWDGGGCSGAPVTLNWQGALQAAKDFRFAGHDDWRLPNKNELEAIVEERCASPAINRAVFPATPPAYFWSASPYAGLSSGAWSVDFGFGSVNATVKSGNIHVRLVRGP